MLKSLLITTLVISGLSAADPPLVCQNGGVLVNEACICPSLFDQPDCSSISCINGGYPKDNKCVCPMGYMGIHCEAVQLSVPPDDHFKVGETSINLMNFNLYTRYWGKNTYQNVQKAVADHLTKVKYSNYALMETTGNGKYDMGTDDYVFDIKYPLTQDVFSGLSPATETGVYHCYTVEIYASIAEMIKKASLQNAAITIITQHPPSTTNYYEARQAAAAFNVKINVIFLLDQTFNNCDPSDISSFQQFAEQTGGIFVQLKAEMDDASTQSIVNTILATHANAQFITIQAKASCDDGPFTFAMDTPPPENATYHFTFFGDNINILPSSFTGCGLHSPAKSADGKAFFFETIMPSCNSFSLTANGPCSAMVYYSSIYAPSSTINIYTTYVESDIIDSSRYAIVENVKLFPALHVVSVEVPDIKINSISYVSSAGLVQQDLLNRFFSTFELSTMKPIVCSANAVQSLQLNISVTDTYTAQRAVRVNCIPKTLPPTSPPTTIQSTSSPTTMSTTTMASTTTQVPSTTTIDGCDTPDTNTIFMFAFPADANVFSYSSIAQTIMTYLPNQANVYPQLQDVRTDQSSVETIREQGNTQLFADDLTKFKPDPTKGGILDDSQASTFPQIVKNYLDKSSNPTMEYTHIENSVFILLVNRLPATNDAILANGDFDLLTNQNVKMFTLISFTSLINQAIYLSAGRSGTLLNKLAASTNGHYIIANDTLNEDGVSDLSQITGNIMQFSYEDLLFTRNIHADRAAPSLGTLRLPSATGSISVTITISLSAVDNHIPLEPSRLLIAFQANGPDAPTVAVDFLNDANVVHYPSSNFYMATVTLPAGLARNLVLQYSPGNDNNDVLIRMWNDRNLAHSTRYMDMNGKALNTTDTANGAAIVQRVYSDCVADSTGYIYITDCNGDVSTKYDVNQITSGEYDGVRPTEGGAMEFMFVPFFCDDVQPTKTCISGAESKYDFQFVVDNFSVSRSFQCRKSTQNIPIATCAGKDAYGNYQCSGTSPFKRGPTGQIPDCSGHGHVVVDTALQDKFYTDIYTCKCDDGYNGTSCQEVTCATQNLDALSIDNTYHTYTVILGVDRDAPYFVVGADAAETLDLSAVAGEYKNIWKYQLFTYCLDGTVENMYSGNDQALFRAAFNANPKKACNAAASVNYVDLTDVYNTAVRGLGRNTRGIIAYYTESPVANLNVSVDAFIAASQPYQQQIFVFSATESNAKTDPITKLGDDVTQAVLTTGGFPIHIWIDPSNGPTYQNTFIPSMLTGATSISYYSATQSAGFTVTPESKSSVSYLIAFGAGSLITSVDPAKCIPADDTSITCLLTGENSYTIPQIGKQYTVIVYSITDVSPKAQIISSLSTDFNDAVSTSTSDTRTILSVYVPDGYKVIASTTDTSTRTATRKSCTFAFTSYSVFVDAKYTNGFNYGMITLQKKDDTGPMLTRYFPFGTSTTNRCRRGDVVSSTGSCSCQDGYTGSDCSLVTCDSSSQRNAWSDVCFCKNVGDAVCAQNLVDRYSN